MRTLSGRLGFMEFTLVGGVLVLGTLLTLGTSSVWHRQIAGLRNRSELGALLEQRLVRMKVHITNNPIAFLKNNASNSSSPVEFNPLVDQDLNEPGKFGDVFQMPLLMVAGDYQIPPTQRLELGQRVYAMEYEVKLLKAGANYSDPLLDCNFSCKLDEVAVIHVQIRAKLNTPHISTVDRTEIRDLFISI